MRITISKNDSQEVYIDIDEQYNELLTQDIESIACYRCIDGNIANYEEGMKDGLNLALAVTAKSEIPEEQVSALYGYVYKMTDQKDAKEMHPVLSELWEVDDILVAALTIEEAVCKARAYYESEGRHNRPISSVRKIEKEFVLDAKRSLKLIVEDKQFRM